MSEREEVLARFAAEIDAADEALIAALERRASVYRELSTLRASHPDLDPEALREDAAIGRARERAQRFPVSAVEPVFREVLSACRGLVAPCKVVYLGPEGGFAHLGARRRFGAAASLRATETIAGVLDEVARGNASFGMVPLETSADGSLTTALHALSQSEVKICAELTLPSSYHLLAPEGRAADGIDTIYGAPQAVASSERFLRMHFPRATIVDVPSGEIAAHFAREETRAAAIGTDIVVELHGLSILHEKIEDLPRVDIRLAAVGRSIPERSGTDRTVLAMAVHDRPGALSQALHPFANRGINLTRLESKAVANAEWNYLFFVEMDGHISDRAVLAAIEDLRSVSRHVRILGSYPRPT